jgi:iron(III) transport system ATP-binding protein
MADLVIEALTRRFADVVAVKSLSLRVSHGEFITLLGPSGCGKSTTLASVAGLDRPEEGLIRLGDKVFFDSNKGLYLPPEARSCGLVFQSYALWPHMTVRANVEFPLVLRKIKSAEITRRVHEVLELVEMTGFMDRYPHQLSGGQQQRVALARTLVYQPEILLLDEPLSNLDAKLRDRARLWLAELRTKLGLTTIYVTHDQLEALALSDRIVLMRNGEIAQAGAPQQIYERPSSPFVADFLGTTNFIHGKTLGTDNAGIRTFLVDKTQRLSFKATQTFEVGSSVTIALRPEHITIVPPDTKPESGKKLSVSVTSHAYVGGRWQITASVGKDLIRLESANQISGSTIDIIIIDHIVTVFPEGSKI